MKLKDIVAKTDNEIQTLVADSRKAIAALAIDMRTKEVTGVKQIAAHKRIIARSLTVLRQRELTAQGDNQ
jgi:ribosomal protein L29